VSALRYKLLGLALVALLQRHGAFPAIADKISHNLSPRLLSVRAYQYD
jgi:hypothetical protein